MKFEINIMCLKSLTNILILLFVFKSAFSERYNGRLRRQFSFRPRLDDFDSFEDILPPIHIFRHPPPPFFPPPWRHLPPPTWKHLPPSPHPQLPRPRLPLRPPLSMPTETRYLDPREDTDVNDLFCGISFKINQLIVNGEVFDEGTYPWLVAVFVLRSNGLNFICGGTLVSNKHIITAAHCVKSNDKTIKADKLYVVLGKCNLEQITSITSDGVYAVTSVQAHPDYKILSGDGDIAVLTVKNIKFNKKISPACLWRGGNNLDDVVGRRGIVAGWGKNENGTLSLNHPRVVKMPIVSQESCLRSNPRFFFITSGRTFCAGLGNGSGPCNGDSGSGLILQERGLWVLRGLVSISLGLSGNICDLNSYVVFVDISKYYKWLSTVIK